MSQDALREPAMIDLKSADNLQVDIIGNKVWVNVNGVCLLRAYRVKHTLVTHNNTTVVDRKVEPPWKDQR